MRSCLAFLLLFAFARCATPVAVSQGPVPREPEQVFQETLSPHGEWIVVTPYGRVWSPRAGEVGPDFRPYYTRGHWVHTNYGWSFESDWSWGWVPFHYGRWYLDSGYGWVWVPGRSWAPAWVTWRYGGGYVGWAPLQPAGSGILVESYNPTWCFLETRRFTAPDLDHHFLPAERHPVAFGATVPAAETMKSREGQWPVGPAVAQVSQEIGQTIHTQNVALSKSAEVAPHKLQPPVVAKTTPAQGPGAKPTPSESPKSQATQASPTSSLSPSAPTAQRAAGPAATAVPSSPAAPGSPPAATTVPSSPAAPGSPPAAAAVPSSPTPAGSPPAALGPQRNSQPATSTPASAPQRESPAARPTPSSLATATTPAAQHGAQSVPSAASEASTVQTNAEKESSQADALRQGSLERSHDKASHRRSRSKSHASSKRRSHSSSKSKHRQRDR